MTCTLHVAWDDRLTRYDFGPGHPLAPIRVELTIELARDFGVLNADGVTVFVSITTSHHTQDWLDRFHEALNDFPEVVEFYRMSGQVDYLLRVVVPDIERYDAFYKKLISRIELSDVSSAFAMEQIKYTTALPLDYAAEEKRS